MTALVVYSPSRAGTCTPRADSAGGGTFHAIVTQSYTFSTWTAPSNPGVGSTQQDGEVCPRRAECETLAPETKKTRLNSRHKFVVA